MHHNYCGIRSTHGSHKPVAARFNVRPPAPSLPSLQQAHALVAARSDFLIHAGVAQWQSSAFVKRWSGFRNSLPAPDSGATTACVAFPAAPQLVRGMACNAARRLDRTARARCVTAKPRSGRRRVGMAAEQLSGLLAQCRALGSYPIGSQVQVPGDPPSSTPQAPASGWARVARVGRRRRCAARVSPQLWCRRSFRWGGVERRTCDFFCCDSPDCSKAQNRGVCIQEFEEMGRCSRRC